MRGSFSVRAPTSIVLSGPPKEHIMLFWGEAEARVAFMPLSGIRCDRVAEREGNRCVLHFVGEAVKAHQECPVDIRRSNCAARVRSALTAERT